MTQDDLSLGDVITIGAVVGLNFDGSLKIRESAPAEELQRWVVMGKGRVGIALCREEHAKMGWTEAWIKPDLSGITTDWPQ